MTGLSSISPMDRAKGALLGLALGDALGTTVEFRERGSFEPLTGLCGGGPFNLKSGQWTDDTSMMLCLADSLLATGENDPDDQINRYLRWQQHGENSSTGSCFDIGSTVSKALQRYTITANPLAGSTDEWSAGNGSLMRIAPIALFHHAEPLPVLLDAAAVSSRTTHGEIRCIQACQLFCYYLQKLLCSQQTPDKQQLLFEFGREMTAEMADWHPDIKQLANGNLSQKSVDNIKGSGFVVESLEAALWCFLHSDSFEQGALMAANLGDDADTTAAIYGQLAGAYYGYSELPSNWLSQLFWYSHIENIAVMLVNFPAEQDILTFLKAARKGLSYLETEDKISDEKLEFEFLTATANHDICFTGLNWLGWVERNGIRHMLPSERIGWIQQAGLGDCLALFTSTVRATRFVSGAIILSIRHGVMNQLLNRIEYHLNDI
ncbi:ADP-ribosylglycohydrolase family protein [Endozoicomonadaceae bacterium StTr2]